VSKTICKHIAKAAQAHAQAKALSKSLQIQVRRKRNFKKCPTARQKTMKMIATNRPKNTADKEALVVTRVLRQAGVTCKLGALCFYSSTVLVDSFVLLSPPERKARKRYASP